MLEDRTLVTSRLRMVSVGLSAASLAFFALGMLLSWSRLAVLIVPVVLGIVALVLAISARGSGAARPGRVIAVVLSVVAMIVPAATFAAVLAVDSFAPSATYTLTVDSPDPLELVIKDGADLTTQEWEAGDTITLDSNSTVISIGAQTSTPTTAISCEIRRDGDLLATDERAGSVNCSYIE